jgi:hypothetical protein
LFPFIASIIKEKTFFLLHLIHVFHGTICVVNDYFKKAIANGGFTKLIMWG